MKSNGKYPLTGKFHVDEFVTGGPESGKPGQSNGKKNLSAPFSSNPYLCSPKFKKYKNISMATITRENISLLNDKLTVKLSKEDYYGNFEKTMKQQAKTANIPGFRKGMVPAGLVKKMYGQNVFQDEVLKTVEKEMNAYLSKEQLDIFAQPIPLENEGSKLDLNYPGEVDFYFEIGLKPLFDL